MNLKPQFELFVNLARQQAESRESRNQADIRLFLFAIEIGLKRKLTPEEKIVYEKTFRTAYLLSGIAVGQAPPSAYDQIAAGCVSAWLEWEPQIRTRMEKTIGQSIDEPYQSHGMSPEMRGMVVEGLSILYGDEISKEEIAVFLDQLEHPLDRA
jgi:hypothetical protein